VTKQSIQTIKMGLMAFSLFALVACSSSGDTDESGAMGSEGSSSSSSSGSTARTNPGSTSGQLTQEEIRAQNALRQTVFYFDFDIAEFKAADRETLSFHARDLAANSSKRIRLEGHADERGTREYNLALGERRANSVLNYLIVNGASRSQIEVVSYGEERPAQQGQSENAYNRNRRVEVVAR
jgi:peptidoglycan-associated lipoprotein